MEFSEFAEKTKELEEESGNEQTNILAELFSEAEEDLEELTRFTRGEVFPAWDNTKTNIGPALVYKAISNFAGVPEDDVKEKVAEVGDEGVACEQVVRGGKKQSTVLGFDGGSSEEETTVGDVYESFQDIAEMSGSGSQKRKVEALSTLLSGMTPLETRYLVRIPLKTMRIGVGDGTVRDAISIAFDVPASVVEKGYMMSNDYGQVARVAKEEGVEGLENIKMTVGQPVQPMLAKSDDEVDDIIEELGEEVACEIKYDGARLQIHKDDDEVRLFTRNLTEQTEALPDVVNEVKEKVDDEKVILDSEVIAYEDGKSLDFNEMQKRLNRKHDVEDKKEEINLEIEVFDVLYRNGNVLIDKPLKERREIMDEVYPDPVVNHPVSTEQDIHDAREMAVNRDNEGVMVKRMDSSYEPNNRGKKWIKVKPEAETIDCVVVGGKWGKGDRKGNVGTYRIAVKNGDDFVEVGKVGNGMTEEQLEELTEKFESLVTSEDGLEVDFRPEVVFEVSYEEIQESPDGTLSLRFPVLSRVRETKSAEEADTLSRLEQIRD